MKVTLDQLKSLHKTDPTLYAYVLPAARGVGGDFVEIDESKIPEGTHRKLAQDWAKENGIESEPPQHDPKTCACDTCFQKRTAERNDRENERLKLAAAAKAAAQRLLQYIQQGLKDNEHNREQWAAFEAQLPKELELSAELVDQFIAGWKNVLQWGPPPTPAPAPAPAEPEQVVLKDGSLQKGLDETPSHG